MTWEKQALSTVSHRSRIGSVTPSATRFRSFCPMESLNSLKGHLLNGANRPPTAIFQSKFDAALLIDVSACGGLALDIGLARAMILRGSGFFPKLIAASDLTNIV